MSANKAAPAKPAGATFCILLPMDAGSLSSEQRDSECEDDLEANKPPGRVGKESPGPALSCGVRPQKQ